MPPQSNDPINPNPAPLTPPSTKPSPVAAPRPRRKRRALKIFVGLLLLLVIFVLGAVIYVQSSHAMLHIILPMASKTLGTSITASDGSAKLNGTVSFSNLIVQGGDATPGFRAESILLKVDTSTLTGGSPVVEEVRLVRPELLYVVDKDGNTNWDFIMKGGEPNPKEAPSDKFPTATVRTLAVTDLKAAFRDSTGLDAAIGGLNLSLRDLAPGSTAKYEFSGGLDLKRPGQAGNQTGQWSGAGDLTQSADGSKLEETGKFQLALSGLDAVGGMPKQLAMETSFGGSLTAAGAIRQKLELTAETPEGPVGALGGNVDWDPESGARKADFNVTGLSRDFLNPFLMAIAPVQLNGGRIDAAGTIDGNAEKMDFSATFNAADLSAIIGGDKTPTPPMTIKLAQSGSFSSADGMLSLKTLSANVINQGKLIVEAALSEPMNLKTSGGAAAQSLASSTAKLDVAVHDLSVAIAKPFLAMVDKSGQNFGLKSGTVNGAYAVAVAQQGAELQLSGKMVVSDIRHAAIAGDPLRIEQSVDATVANLKDAKIKSVAAKILSGSRLIADATASGGFDAAGMKGNVDFDLKAPLVLGSLRELGLLAGPPPTGVGDGNIAAAQKATFDFADAANPKMNIEGTGGLEGFSVSLRGSQPNPLGARLNNKIAMAGQRVQIGALHVELDQPAPRKTGVIDVTGDWPLAPAGAGKLEVTTADIDLGPWIKMVRALPGDALPEMPLKLKAALDREANGRIGLVSEGSIGTTLAAANGKPAEAITVELASEVRILGEKIEKFVIDFAGKGSGPDDKVHVEASGTVGAMSDITADANISTFNADRYMAWMQQITPPTPVATPTPTPVPQQAPAAPPVKLNATWKLGEATYQGTKVSDGAGSVRMDNGVADLAVDQLKVGQGIIAAKASYDMARIDPRYSWTGSLTQAPAPELMALADPKLAEKLSGMISAETKGSGEGTGEAMAQHLGMETKFVVKDGELRGLPFLDKLGELTGVTEFQNLKFFEFTGGVVMEQGKGRLDNMRVTGPAARIAFEGTFDMAMNYDIRVDPYLSGQRIASTKYAQYAAIASDADGYVRLPLSLAVAGKGPQYSLRPTASLPIATGAGGKPDLGGALRGAIGVVVEKQLEKDQEKAAKSNDAGTTAAATSALPTTATQPVATPKPKAEDLVKEALGGLLNR